MKATWRDVSTKTRKRHIADYKGARIAVEDSGRKKAWVTWVGGLKMRSGQQPTSEAAKMHAEDLVDQIQGIGKTWPKDGKKEKAK